MTSRLAVLLLCAVVTGISWPTEAATLDASITNVAPTIASISVSGLVSGTLTPTAGTTSSMTVTVVASDLNGFADVSGVTVGIIKPDGSTVHVAQGAATFSTGSGLLATYTKTVTMAYYDAAALTSSTYKVKAIATDAAALAGTNALTLSTFNYAELAALNAPSTISLGGAGITPGQAGSINTVSVGNYGNVQIDTQVSGTDLTYSSNTIPKADISYSLASNMGSSAALSSTPATSASFDLAPASGAAKNMYFQVTATPTGLPSGSYTGTVTLTAIAG